MPSRPTEPDPAANPANPWLRSVILHHRLPPRAGSHAQPAHGTTPAADHFDWLIETPPAPGVLPTDDDRTLICFRCAERPDELIAIGQPFTAERLADHRRLYLHFEGELSDNRGTVTRVATGAFRIHEASQRAFIGEFDFAEQRCAIRANRTNDEAASWHFERP